MPRQKIKDEWIIYWDDNYKKNEPVVFCAVGSKAAAMCPARMMKSFHGTYQEVREEVRRLNEKYKVTLPKNYTGSMEREKEIKEWKK